MDMNRLYIPLVLTLILMVFVAGCTPVDTADERSFRILAGWNIQSRQAVEDFDTIMLFDQSRMSLWHAYTGY